MDENLNELDESYPEKSDIYDVSNTPVFDSKTAKNLSAQRKKSSSKSAPQSNLFEGVSNIVQGTQNIIELARALRNDPQLIFQWVYQNVEYTPINGVQKGASCVIDGHGTAFDQCALLVALLRQAALTNEQIVEANFVHGKIQLTFAQCQAWLGIKESINVALSLFTNGGFLPTLVGVSPNQLLEVEHCWVQLKLEGDLTYVLDPSFKSYERVDGLSDLKLAQWMGYTDVETFIAGATEGATIDPGGTWVQNLNTTNINNQLSTLSTNLIAAIRKHDSDWTSTLGGTVTADDIATITVYNADFDNGKAAVSYTVQAGDSTLAEVASGLADAINSDPTVSGVGVSAAAVDDAVAYSHGFWPANRIKMASESHSFWPPRRI